MSQNFIALDFGSGQIAAVLSVYDEATGTCRVRHALREPCPSINGCYILDFDRTVATVSRVLAQMNDFITFTPTVAVGLRGGFLSYRRSSGFKNIDNKNGLISDQDVRDALDNSVPPTLPETLEVVDLLPLSYNVEGAAGVQNPVGLAGLFLEAETFLSLGVKAHLNNLNRVMVAAGCEDFEAAPTILTLCDTLLKPEEKQGSLMLLDIGAQNSSAALYYKGFLQEAFELPIGADVCVQEVAEVLQQDLPQTRKMLRSYAYGDDEVMDDVLDEAARKMLKKLHKEFTQSLNYIQHPPAQLVLTGGGAEINVKNAAKGVLGVRRTRIASHESLIADSEDLLAPAYTSALSLALYSQRHGGMSTASQNARQKATGFLDKMLTKLGLN